MISFIYFDIGGTLMDYTNVFHDAAIRFGLGPQKDEIGKVFDENHDAITKGHMRADDIWRLCVKRYRLRDDDTFDFLQSWYSDFRPITPMHLLVRKAIKKYPLGLLSNIYTGMVPLLLEREIIPNIAWSTKILSCDQGVMKPEPAIYAIAQQASKYPAHEILFVDDSEKAIEGAKQCGWQTFTVNPHHAITSVEALQKLLGIRID